ncbi:MAG: response regulator [Bacillota bacterium]
MKQILVIEDNLDIQYTLKEICSHAGWQTIMAENGYLGLQLFKNNKFDLIIADYHLPVLDGLMTLRAIREIDKKIPVLVLTVDERQELADELLAAGATDFALKPIKAPDLIARIMINLKVGALTQEQESAYINKGINKNTQSIIINYLRHIKSPVLIEEISQGTNLAYQTVHRYLSYLVQEKMVESDFDYGKKGRPKNVYWLKN